MREDGTAEDSSSSSFMVIGGGGAGGRSDDDNDDRGQRRFVRCLDSKLKKLQRRAAGSTRTPSRKPVFVTTVKTGLFLDPPPDLAALLGLDNRSSSAADGPVHPSTRYYSYSSKPRVLYDKQHQRATAATVTARKYDRQPDTGKQMGYTNIMHDKRVVRGSNFSKKTFRPKWNPYFGYAKQLSSESNFQNESAASREAEVRRRTMARKKAMDYQTRALRLHLGAPKLPKGRQNVDIQTDMHLEELYDEYPKSQTFGAQTELDEPIFNLITEQIIGIDASTQVDEKDLFDFEIEMTPIAESLITDVFREAMLEVLYEDELDARARQHKALYMQRSMVNIEREKLKHENDELSKVIDDHTRHYEQRGSQLESDTGDTKSDTAAPCIESPELVTWLKEELNVESDDMLKDMIRDLMQRRLDVH